MDEPHTPPEPTNDTLGPTLRRLERDLGGLVATVDQLTAQLEAQDVVAALTAFAFGCLAAIVFLQGRQLKELTDAAR